MQQPRIAGFSGRGCVSARPNYSRNSRRSWWQSCAARDVVRESCSSVVETEPSLDRRLNECRRRPTKAFLRLVFPPDSIVPSVKSDVLRPLADRQLQCRRCLTFESDQTYDPYRVPNCQFTSLWLLYLNSTLLLLVMRGRQFVATHHRCGSTNRPMPSRQRVGMVSDVLHRNTLGQGGETQQERRIAQQHTRLQSARPQPCRLCRSIADDKDSCSNQACLCVEEFR